MNAQRMTDYFEDFIVVAIKNTEHLEIFLRQAEFNNSEKIFLRDLWNIHTGYEALLLKYEEEILDMDKEELEEHALEEFDVDLDKRHNIPTLIEQVIELKENKES